MNILALSSSRVGDSAYLEPAIPFIKSLLGEEPLRLAFIPFASVASYEEYFQKVSGALKTLPHSIELMTDQNAKQLLAECEGVLVGGGNTFKLLHDLYELAIIDLIRTRVRNGLPYIGWSAGSNILGARINTTNDMPIVQPKSFDALQIFPFQINPHYFNQSIPGFNGEIRDQRIEEFLTINQNTSVVALPEGCALVMKINKIIFKGDKGYRFTFQDGDMHKVDIRGGQEIDL